MKLKPNSVKVLKAMKELNLEYKNNSLFTYKSLSELTQIDYTNIGKYIKELIGYNLIYKEPMGNHFAVKLTEKGFIESIENLSLINGNPLDAEIVKDLIILMANNNIDIPKEIRNNEEKLERLMALSEEIK